MRRLLAAVAVATAVGAGHPGAAASQVPPRAAWILEPSVLTIGQVATLDLIVSLPAAHRALPYLPPQATGLRVLDASDQNRFRVQPTRLGSASWPSSTLVIEGPDGKHSSIEIPELRIDVASVLPKDLLAGIAPPNGLRLPPAPPALDDRGIFASDSGLAGLGTAFAFGLGVGALAFRGRPARAGRANRSGSQTRGSAGNEGDLWTWADAELERARAALTDNAADAATIAARVLRLFATRRFDVALEASTTPELSEQTPPFGARSRWPQLVALLGELDRLRFPEQRASNEQRRRAVASAIDRAKRFVDTTRPQPDAAAPERQTAARDPEGDAP